MTEMIVACPICQTKVLWTTDNIYRPFCSERCRLIDFGEWANGNRYIPTDTEYDDISVVDLDED